MGLRVGGLASGLDSDALVDALMTLERVPLERARARRAELEQQQSLLGEFGTQLSALRDAAAAIDNRSSGLSGNAFEEELLAYTATSSDEDVLTATASGSATPGTTEIEVLALAQVARRISAGFSDPTDPSIASEGDTLVIAHGGDESPISITVGAGGVSLVDLKDLINGSAENGGAVRADVIFDGTSHRLVVAGTEPGVGNDVTLTTSIQAPGGGAFLDPAVTQQDASDAQLRAFGLAITRESNSISDLVPGVLIELGSARPGETVSVDVARDDEEIEARVQAFVDAYNGVVDFIQNTASYDVEEETAGLLISEGVVKDTESRLRRIAIDFYGAPGEERRLGEIGIDVDPSSGRLSLDAGELRETLSSDAGAVRELFHGIGPVDPEDPEDANHGIASRLVSLIDRIVDADPGPDPDSPQLGPLAIRNQSFKPQYDALDRQIERLEFRLERREELLVQRFTQLETLVGQLQTQGGALDSLQQLPSIIQRR